MRKHVTVIFFSGREILPKKNASSVNNFDKTCVSTLCGLWIACFYFITLIDKILNSNVRCVWSDQILNNGEENSYNITVCYLQVKQSQTTLNG